MNELISTPRRNQSHSRRGAFSLLEVAFALVIFVIGAIALLRIFPGGLSILEDSGNRRVASQMSQNLLTAYNSGDLASTTPEAIYEGDLGGVWVDYPSSALGLRRQQGTIPLGTDDLRSAKDALRYIRGERQGAFIIQESSAPAALLSSCVTSYPAAGRVNVYREGIVDGVSVYPGGVLDFRNALYSTANREDVDKATTRVPFREPILKVDSVVSTPAATASYGAYSPRVILSSGADAVTYTLTLARDYTSGYGTGDVYAPPSLAAAADTTPVWVGGTAPGGFAATITPAADNVTVSITVPASATPRDATSFQINLKKVEGLSLNCAYLVVELNDTRGGAAVTTPQPSAPLLAVQPPKQFRYVDPQPANTTNTTFYVSTSEGQDQPLRIPASDTTSPTVPGYVPTTVLSPKVRFRQELGAFTPENDRTQVVMRPVGTLGTTTGTIPDIDNRIPRIQYTNFLLDYRIRDWEYVSEDIAQFGTPYPGDTQNYIDTTTPEGQAQQQFVLGAGYTQTNKMLRGDLREIRTRLGSLRGPIQIKAFYGQSTDIVTLIFSPRTAPQEVGTLTTDQQKAYIRQVNTLMKEGRLYVPGSRDGQPLTQARIYYRSRDAWAQQVGVTPPHYMPYTATGIREPWREYAKGTDNYLYFHASDAGKVVEVVHGPDAANTSVTRMEIRPQVIVNNIPAGVLAGFATAYDDGDNTVNDPREGKTYLARSQDRITDTIFDIRRPEGTSGISVRTLWLNNDRYFQEVAQ